MVFAEIIDHNVQLGPKRIRVDEVAPSLKVTSLVKRTYLDRGIEAPPGRPRQDDRLAAEERRGRFHCQPAANAIAQMTKHQRAPYRLSVTILVLLIFALLATSCRPEPSQADEVDVGNDRAIQNKGSDTLVNVALAWAENYRFAEPDVSIAVTGGGSGTGIASLINGTVDIANASRSMKESEVEDARANGIEPVEHVVAIDALAIIVHPDNPVSELTIGQLSDIYAGRVTNWKEVGGNDASIVLLSRETNSGTHVYFLEEVVRRGEEENQSIFAPQTILMPSSVGITSELRRNPNAIGYDGLGYVDPEHEKIIAVAEDADSPFVFPGVETALAGTYPLARDLYMYTAGEPTGEVANYLNWILSPAGQEIVTELGFVPVMTDS